MPDPEVTEPIVTAAEAVDLSAVTEELVGMGVEMPVDEVPVVETPTSEPADTVVADDAADTVVADEGADTVVADAAPDPVVGETPVPIAQPVEVVPDAAGTIAKANADYQAANAAIKAAEEMYDGLPEDDLLNRGQITKQRNAIAAAQQAKGEAEKLYQQGQRQQDTFIQQQNTAFFANLAKEVPLTPAEHEKLYGEELAKYNTKYPGHNNTTLALDRAVERAKSIIAGRSGGRPPAVPAVAKRPIVVRPITKGGASAPPASRPPVNVNKTMHERVSDGEYDLSDTLKQMGIDL